MTGWPLQEEGYQEAQGPAVRLHFVSMWLSSATGMSNVLLLYTGPSSKACWLLIAWKHPVFCLPNRTSGLAVSSMCWRQGDRPALGLISKVRVVAPGYKGFEERQLGAG